LAADAERDPDGWAVLHLRFERLESAVQRLLQLGPEIEVLEPDDLRARLADAATKLNRLYRRRHA
jgi:predicted DNA-binding transcriptional regulator YafY